MIDHSPKAVAELTELSSAEMEQVQGGSLSLNFTAIKFQNISMESHR